LSVYLHDKVAELPLPAEAWFGLLPLHPSEAFTYTLRAETAATFISIEAQTLPQCAAALQHHVYSALHTTWVQLWQLLATTCAEVTATTHHLRAQLHQHAAVQQDLAEAEVIQQAIANLPKLPASTHQLLAAVNDEQSSIDQLIDLVHQDPTVSGLVLQHVNSAAYGLPRPIASIQHAIAYLGRDALYQIVLQDSLHRMLPADAAFAAIQHHSTVIALIAHVIAAHSPIAKACNPLTLGILHDIGEVVLLGLKRTHEQVHILFDTLDTAAFGAQLLRHWHVPEPLCRVIAQQRLPEFCPPEQLTSDDRAALALLYLAHIYYGFLTSTPCVGPTYLDSYIRVLQLTPTDPRQFYHDVLVPALAKQQYKVPAPLRTLLSQSSSLIST
jgi:HD-like signal output (HDOD) protein